MNSLEDLTLDALNQIFDPYLDDPVIINVNKRGKLESTSCNIFYFDVQTQPYDNSIHHNLVLKVFKSNFFNGGVAEAFLYENLSPQIKNPPLPYCYHYMTDKKQNHAQFILQDITKTHKPFPYPLPPGRPSTSEFVAMINQLLKFHSNFWGETDYSTERYYSGPLKFAHIGPDKCIQHYIDQIREQFPTIKEKLADVLSSQWIDFTYRLFDNWLNIVNRVKRKPERITLIHGDAHIWNFFVPKQNENYLYCLIDWETYKPGIAAYDLVYMTMFSLSRSRRKNLHHKLLSYYNQAISKYNINYSTQQLKIDLKIATLMCYFVPLLWSLIPLDHASKNLKRIQKAILDYDLFDLDLDK